MGFIGTLLALAYARKKRSEHSSNRNPTANNDNFTAGLSNGPAVAWDVPDFAWEKSANLVSLHAYGDEVVEAVAETQR